MANVPPFYYLNQLVYHTNDQCPQAQGQGILPLNPLVGMGGKVECLCCRHLNKMELKTKTNARFMKRLLSPKKQLT